MISASARVYYIPLGPEDGWTAPTGWRCVHFMCAKLEIADVKIAHHSAALSLKVGCHLTDAGMRQRSRISGLTVCWTV